MSFKNWLKAPPLRPLFWALPLIALATLVYWPGLGGGFLFDDYPQILGNSAIQATSLTFESLRMAARGFDHGEYGRPLATVTFALNHVAGGLDPRGYKAVNVGIHALNALLAFLLVRQLLRRAWPQSDDSAQTCAAFLIALAWAAHPLQVSSVLYVVQRMETLSATFVLLALLCYVRGRSSQCEGGRGWLWLACSPLLAGVGMLSKETAALFPAFALTIEVTLFNFEPRGSKTSRNLMLLFAVGCVAALAVYAGYLLPKYASDQAYVGRDFNLYERLLTQLRVLPMYLGQSLLPLPASLPFYYDDYPKSTGWLQPATTLVGAVFLSGLLVLAGWLRRRRPLVALGILWFFASHLLTSNIFNLELAFEHRNYLALLGVIFVAADIVRMIPTRDSPTIKYAAVVVVIVGFGLLTTIRSATWANPFLLAMDLAERNPQSPRAATDLGEQYMLHSRMDPASRLYDQAIREYERAARLPGASPLPETGLLLMAAASNREARPEWWQSLIHKIRTRPLGPQERIALYGLLQERYQGVQLDDRQLTLALQALFARTALPPQAYAQFGDYALTYLHDDELADEMFVRALESAPKDAAYAAQIFSTLTADGHARQAKAVLERAHALGLMKGTANASTSDHHPMGR